MILIRSSIIVVYYYATSLATNGVIFVPDNIRIVFHALNDICSEGGGGLISGVVDKLETFTVCVYLRLC